MYLLCLILTTAVCGSVGWLLFYRRRSKRIQIVVLGDIGRSPRMQYHAISFAKAGFQVYIIGYAGSSPVEDILQNDSIRLVHMPSSPLLLNKLPKFLGLVLKVVWQSIVLFIYMIVQWKPSDILLQNPPALPTMAVCYIMSRLRNCRLTIDWHNYGYTILAMSLGNSHPLVRAYRTYEQLCGRLSDINICVTDAMRQDLAKNWNVIANTMHDRPPERFKSLDLSEKHALFYKLDFFRDKDSDIGSEVTKFTYKDLTGQAQYRIDRPALIVSSTSWTEDEDFSILLNALQEYENIADDRLPRLVCAITGKGPQKEYYLTEIRKREWSKIQLLTPWLETEDYPRLLACADLGVCLHKSSSGLDLPMKVVDMFGCGLPVCAVNFNCIGELVKNNQNGLIFEDDKQLSQQIAELVTGHPDECYKLKRFRATLKSPENLRWDEEWNKTVIALITK